MPDYRSILIIWTLIGFAAMVASFYINAPYGRHAAIPGIRKWGPSIPNRLAWFVMEIPTLICFNTFFWMGSGSKTAAVLVMAALYNLHYIYRTIWFPLTMRTSGKKMPFTIALMAITFNIVNGWILGTWLGNNSSFYPAQWLTDPRFIAGLLIFIVGMYIHIRADHELIHLRKPGETGYKIPRGWLFEKISCPNHFGEMLQWTGYAILTWSGAGLVFALWTIFNVLPRSLAHHKWYKSKFEDYPGSRKAVWPGLL